MIRIPAEREPGDGKASDNGCGSAVISAAAFIVRLSEDGDGNAGACTAADRGADYPPFVAVSARNANITNISPGDRLATSPASLQRNGAAFDGQRNPAYMIAGRCIHNDVFAGDHSRQIMPVD
jgi:hypothetical protein